MKIVCMVKGFILGLMEENMKEIMYLTKKKAMENMSGLMEESTKDSGKMENNQDLEFMSTKMAKKEKDIGKMEKESNGSKIIDFENLFIQS